MKQEQATQNQLGGSEGELYVAWMGERRVARLKPAFEVGHDSAKVVVWKREAIRVRLKAYYVST